jgi:hypothetical protein
MRVDEHETKTEARHVANSFLRSPLKLARAVISFFDRFRGAGPEGGASVIDRNHIARTALGRQRDQREIRRVLVHQIGEVKHIHVYTAVETGGVDRIAIIGAARGRDAKRLQQEGEQQNFPNRGHRSSIRDFNFNRDTLRASQDNFVSR